MRTLRTIAACGTACLALGGLGLAGATAATKAQTVTVAANPGGELAFVQKTLTAKAGKVTFRFTNTSSLPHSFALKTKGTDKSVGKTAIITGRTASLTVTLKKGRYTYYCTVPGHEAAGMTGVLTVR
jgi:plastocyanin